MLSLRRPSKRLVQALSFGSALFLVGGCGAKQDGQTKAPVTMASLPAIDYEAPGVINLKDYPDLPEQNVKNITILNEVMTVTFASYKAAADGQCKQARKVERDYFNTGDNGQKILNFEIPLSEELSQKVIESLALREIQGEMINLMCPSGDDKTKEAPNPPSSDNEKPSETIQKLYI